MSRPHTGVADTKADIYECKTCGFKTNPPKPERCPGCRFVGRWVPYQLNGRRVW